MSKENLRRYVSESAPEVNRLLRSKQDASRLLFDDLFEKISVPSSLYRFVSYNHCENLHEGDCFEDLAYLSCTTDIDKCIDHVGGKNIACLEFNFHDKVSCVDVRNHLPECNDEGEFILPRGCKYQVVQSVVYSDAVGIQSFLDQVNSITGGKEWFQMFGHTPFHCYRLVSL